MPQHVAVQHMRDRETRVESEGFLNFSFHTFPIPFLVINDSHCMMTLGQAVIKRDRLGCCLSSFGDRLSPRSGVRKQKAGPTVGEPAIRGGISGVQLDGLLVI